MAWLAKTGKAFSGLDLATELELLFQCAIEPGTELATGHAIGHPLRFDRHSLHGLVLSSQVQCSRPLLQNLV